ncbi:MAG: class I SAM-dependent methyltransferase [bacterium]|nr:class I SAM-dependent methyltransferase [bacterium]
MLKTKCPLCDSLDDYTVIYKSTFKEEDLNLDVFSARRLPDQIHYQIVRCNHDGLVRSTPVYDQSRLENLYKRSKFNYAEQTDNLTVSYLRALGQVLPSLSPEARILEIGCGNGFVLSALLAQGYKNVYGLEPSLDATAKADQRIKNNITTDVLREGLYPPGSFDLIYFLQTLDHIQDPLRFMSICYDLLAPHGFILALNHDVASLSARLLKEKSPIIDIEHPYLYSKDTVSKLFLKTGFSPVKVFSPGTLVSWKYLLWLLPLPKFIKLSMLNVKNRIGHYILQRKLWLKLGNLCIIARKEEKNK